MLNTSKAILLEYAQSFPPLVLTFDFNPQSLTRTRTINLPGGSSSSTRGGYDFTLPTDTPRVAQGVQVEPESFTLDVLFDATDRMNDGDAIASEMGIEPELDTLRSMIEPKSQGPGGMQMLSSLGLGGSRAFQRDETASVLLLVWGDHILPVFLSSIRVEETAHLPNLKPYRANVNMRFQVIEGGNPFYKVEKIRQLAGAGLNVGASVSASFSIG